MHHNLFPVKVQSPVGANLKRDCAGLTVVMENLSARQRQIS